MSSSNPLSLPLLPTSSLLSLSDDGKTLTLDGRFTHTILTREEMKARFELGRQLGSGKSGSVYALTRKDQLEYLPGAGPLAVKSTYHSVRDLTESQFHTILNNAHLERSCLQLAAGIPGIPVYYDSWIVLPEEGHPVISTYLVQEKISGRSLQAQLTDEWEHSNYTLHTYEKCALKILQTLTPWSLKTIGALHARGITHGDVHLGNVLSEWKGESYHLIDFGCASSIEIPNSDFTMDPKPLYFPEHIGLDPKTTFTYTAQMEVYMLGSILYRALKWEFPLPRKVLESNSLKGYEGTPLYQVLSECLQPDPAKRPGAERLLQLAELF